MAVPVHNHSEFSSLDGYGKPEEIAARVAALGLPGAFLTDHGTVTGIEPFAKAMAEHDLFAGFGMEAYQARTSRLVKPESVKTTKIDPETGRKKTTSSKPRDAAHVILLAKNDEGLRNLRRLSDEANRTGLYYNPRVDWELLEKYHEGIICTSACLGGLVSQGLKPLWETDKWIEENPDAEVDTDALNRYLNIFKDDFYIELHAYSGPQQMKANVELAKRAQERGIPVVYASDAHYCSPDEWSIHEVLVSMQQKKSLNEDKGDYGAWNNKKRWHPQDLYIMDAEEISERLKYLGGAVVQEALDSSDEIMAKCKDLRLPEVRTHLPVFQLPAETKAPDSNEFLLDLIEAGISKRYGGTDIEEQAAEQAMYEYKAISEAGLGDYFLIVWDIVNYCMRNNIMVGPGRGSAGGSILAYVLEITNVCPIRYGLYFERFWNPGRADGLPDIDLDIEKARRDDVKAYLRRKYGEYRVLPIGNHIRFQPKSAIDRAGVALYKKEDVPYAAMTLIKAEIDKMVDAGQQPSWEDIWADPEVAAELKMWKQRYPDLFFVAEEMTGRIQSYGQHASAVVISDVDLPEHLPGRMAAEDDEGTSGKKVLVTQHEMNMVEELGFPKFDLLGLKTLDVLKSTITLAGEPNFNFRDLDIDDMDLPDEFWGMLREGLTRALFQIDEGHAAKKIAKQMNARSISDLGAIVALNRPGPLRSGMVDRYIARRAGDEPVLYSHEMLTDILDESLGDFLYQEQVIAYMREVGYDLSEADHVRKILGKKKTELMDALEPGYMEHAANFMPEAKAKSIWEEIKGFSKYSFNKSHAIEYAFILAWTMYAKWRWPTEFIMSNIDVVSKGSSNKRQEKVGSLITEGRRMGVDIKPPHINHSNAHVTKVGDTIYFGLAEIKNVGEQAVEWLIENRPFKDHADLVERLEVSAKEWKDADKAKRHPRSPKQRCTALAVKSLLAAGAFDSMGGRADMDSLDKAELEEDLLGVALTDGDSDLVEEYRDELLNLDTLADLTTSEGDFEVPGVIFEVKTTKIREDAHKRVAGKEMGIVTIRWQGDEARVAVFPQEWSKYRSMLQTRYLGKFSVKVNGKGTSLRKVEIVGY